MTLNEYLLAARNSEAYPFTPRIICKDGFNLSVQANYGAYCTPRSNEGPYLAVEVGFPSASEPLLLGYAEDVDCPTDTVYPYTPITVVEAVIAKHGGTDYSARW